MTGAPTAGALAAPSGGAMAPIMFVRATDTALPAPAPLATVDSAELATRELEGKVFASANTVSEAERVEIGRFLRGNRGKGARHRPRLSFTRH